MSRLNDLLRELRAKDPALAADIEVEVKALADRRAFGLNFERHVPETVELPGRPVRKGDKVRILPPRRTMPTRTDEKLWQVIAIMRNGDSRTVQLEAIDGDETSIASLDDLVVIAEFRDPIYPGLASTGKVERGGDEPYHTVINAENYYALQTLLFTHRGKVDCIYIDPPYNTGARDWKYNNDYVEADDLYRHSKWLAFIERRLLLARELLDPKGSVLVVTIDEKEYTRLGLLLEQTFPDARIQMVTSLINPKGVARGQDFYRVDEYIYFVFTGSAAVQKSPDPMILTKNEAEDSDTVRKVRWGNLLRSGTDARRIDRKHQFYPIFLNRSDGALHSIGEPLLPATADRTTVEAPAGTVAVWPIRKDGSEGRWMVGAATLADLFARGLASVGRFDGSDRVSFSYVTENVLAQIASGAVEITNRDEQGVVQLAYAENAEISTNPKTMWNKQSHSASEYGSTLLAQFIPGRRFPFPKSLYAVEDTVRFCVADKPEAVIVDFFAGSGTTAHAVMRLNKQDGGRRVSISVTNNGVSADEQVEMRRDGLRAGDAEWEARGICENITKPRLRAAVTGTTPDGDLIMGDYKFLDDFPMADGFAANLEFFTLTYEAPLRVASNREFAKIAALLWMRAGAQGRRIDGISGGWDVADTYGVLTDLDQAAAFVQALRVSPTVALAFIVTDEDRLFEAVVRGVPDHVEPVRLYEAYLRNFEIETGRSAL